MSIRCDIYDPKLYQIWFAAAPYSAAGKPAKILRQWAADESADIVYNLALFNMTGQGSDRYGVIKGRTLQYLKAKGRECGYGGTPERLVLDASNAVSGSWPSRTARYPALSVNPTAAAEICAVC